MDDKHKSALKKLKTARGQIDATIKMIEDDRYCMDISNQVLASIGLLKQANLDILEQHIRTCVLHAIKEDKDADIKINEIISVMSKGMKWNGEIK